MKPLMPILLGAALIAGCAAPALASPRPYQDQTDQSRQANTRAYSAGYSQGEADARSHNSRNDQPGSQRVSSADQLAYTQGYDAGYNHAINHESDATTTQLAPGEQQAKQFGYQDGLAAGRQDRRKGDTFKPASHDFYKDATHGWTPALGPKEQFKPLYREGFMQGYEQGYKGTGPQ